MGYYEFQLKTVLRVTVGTHSMLSKESKVQKVEDSSKLEHIANYFQYAYNFLFFDSSQDKGRA
jgi:hypothetical protein